MQGLLHQLMQLLLLLLALSAATALAAAKQAETEDATGGDLPPSGFTEAKLTNARERLAELFDDKLDTNKDGKVTRRELTAWLAAVARQQAEGDLDDAWRLYTTAAASAATSSSSSNNSSTGTNETQHQLLDWEAYASARAKAAAGKTDEVGDEGARGDEAANMAGLQAEVRRAIAEASKETGLDKVGIKVSMPPAPPPAPPKKLDQQQQLTQQQQQQEQEQQRQLRQEQLAVELAKDRRRWDAADADGDGRLSREEFRDFAFADSRAARMRPVLAREALERMDANGDGRVSLVEFLAEGEAAHDGGETATATTKADDAKNFRQVWDANKDGYMDAEEMEKMLDYLDSSAATATAKPKGDGEGESVGDEEDADESHAEEADRLMASSDTDRDGSLTKAEVLGGLVEFAGSAATHYGDSVGVHDEL